MSASVNLGQRAVTFGADTVYQEVSARPPGCIEVWNNGSETRAITPLLYHRPGGVVSPRNTVKNVFSGSRSVDGTFFNIHVFDTDAVGMPTDIDYYGVRVHDTQGPITKAGVRWHNIQSAPGTFYWGDLDVVIDRVVGAGKVPLYMVIGTPNFAAASTPNTGLYDNGTTFTGSNQPLNAAGETAIAEFGTALAQRYNGVARGRIPVYEMWNEVNYSNFYAGTQAQYAKMLRLFRNAVRAVDATLKVGAPTIQEPEGTGDDWLQTFLAASDGAAGTGKDHMDYCFVHLYPPIYNFGIVWDQMDRVQNLLTAAGVGSLETWNTETGVLRDPARTFDPAWKAAKLKKSLALAAAKGVKRYFWYTYDNPNMPMTSPEKDAWQQMRDVLIGKTITNCNILPDERVCITVGGQDYTF